MWDLRSYVHHEEVRVSISYSSRYLRYIVCGTMQLVRSLKMKKSDVNIGLSRYLSGSLYTCMLKVRSNVRQEKVGSKHRPIPSKYLLCSLCTGSEATGVAGRSVITM